jgi:hypothetical protein
VPRVEIDPPPPRALSPEQLRSVERESDRLVHHATMVTLKGKSYRLRERAAATDKPRQRARPQALS